MAGGGGCAHWKFQKRTPKRGHIPVLWVWLELLSPTRGTISKILLSYFVSRILNVNSKATAVDFLRMNNLIGTKTALPLKYTASILLIWEFPCGGRGTMDGRVVLGSGSESPVQITSHTSIIF